MGVFEQYVAKGMRPFACLGKTPQELAVSLAALGVSPAALRETLRGLYGREASVVWRSARFLWVHSGSVWAVQSLVVALGDWDCAPMSLRHGGLWVPAVWWERRADRLLLLSGWLARA